MDNSNTAETTLEDAAQDNPWRRRFQHIRRPFRQSSRTSRTLIFVGLGIGIFFILLAVVGPMMMDYGPTQYRVEVAPGQFQPIPQLAPPSSEHWFGTTRTGYDVLARVIGGAKLALIVMALAVSIAMLTGVPLGLASGYKGGKIDRALVTVMDAIYAFPPLVLAIIISFVLAAYISPGVVSAAAAVGLIYIPQYFRVVRNQTLSVKQEPFVEAARSLGARTRTILSKYVSFNVIHTVPVILTLNAADSILTLAALGFLGYGVEPPTAEWGFDISQAISDVAAGVWWTAFFPGLAIVILVTGMTLLGEGINDIVNPLLRAKGASGPKVDTIPDDDDDNDTDTAHDDNAVSVRNLRVGYRTPDGPLWAVDGVDFDIHRGESLGLVGESGCGKSSLGRALMQLMPPGGATRGRISVDGKNLVGASQYKLRKSRGDDISLIFQEPMTRLNPLMKVSEHFIEMIHTHHPRTPHAEAREMARKALAQMGIPPTRIDSYPHEFSGGMRQRVMIALSIVLEPNLIIADEPTTSLDVIVESQILDILARLRSEADLGLLLITHNLGLVAETCDRVAVMYAGKVVEIGPVEQIFNNPKHPYTRGLLASTISLETKRLHSIEGYPPNLVDPPTGCRFAARCPYVMPHCRQISPHLTTVGDRQQASCFMYEGAGADVPDDVNPPEGNPQVVGI